MRALVQGLGRLLALIGVAGCVIAGTLVSVAVLGSDALHHSATASELPLPPLNSVLQEGSTVYADDGKTVLAVLHGPEIRKPISLSQVSKTLIMAVLDTEDHGFYLHGGFYIPSIVRAFLNDASGQSLQGGSTIPQQLVKQLYLGSERTLSRKVREAVLADRLEQRYSKNQILQAYLNTIYLGAGQYGVEAAAEYYFREPASKLNVPQSALLAGMISNPTGYDPILHPVASRDRRTEVLARMATLHDITPAEEAAANATALPTPPPPPAASDTISNYYVEWVRNQLLAPGSPLGGTDAERYAALYEGGLRIYTNLDPAMQAAAEQTVAADTPVNSGGFEEGLVSIDPTNGAVRALVGGTGTQNSDFNVMTEGRRQPGSGFKIFTLLAALQQGYSVYDSVDANGPCAIKFPGNSDLVKTPIKNDAGPGGGVINLVSATANSVNCAYIRLAHEVGLANVVSMAQALGVSPAEIPHSLYDYIPSVVIGAAAVHPIEMAGAYAALADGGVFHTPTFINTIVDRGGSTIYTGLDPGHRVFSEQVAAEADVAFRAVVTSGTGTAASLYDRPVAGKTGTTSNNVDAWFNGFTPQLETTVWMGSLQAEVPILINGVYVYGANYPARTWHDYSATVLADDPVETFPLVDYSMMPATKYITSPALVADDVSNHNGGGYYGYCDPTTGICSYPPPTYGYYPSPTTGGGPPGTTTGTTPSTTPSNSPPTTVHHRKPPGPPPTVPVNG